jgi:hypothetical protein
LKMAKSMIFTPTMVVSDVADLSEGSIGNE